MTYLETAKGGIIHRLGIFLTLLVSAILFAGASNAYGATKSSSLLQAGTSSPSNQDITPPAHQTGFFYDPSHDGEGFVIDIIADGRAVVYWFTYTETGDQRWFIGVGEVDETGITVGEWITTRGAQFGPAFDPDDVEKWVAGSGRFTFNGCDSMSADYVINGVTGQQNLTRITSVPDIGCDTAKSHRSGLSGDFFDPTRDGEGIVVHVFGDDDALAVFFTYDHTGEQMWVIGQGKIAGPALQFDWLLSTQGGRFGPDFDPDQVQRTPWGELDLQLGCESTSMAYRPDDVRLSEGSSAMIRLTHLAGLSCDAGSSFELPQIECGTTVREHLGAEKLSQTFPDPLVTNSAFRPAQGCAKAKHEFAGTLTFEHGTIIASRPISSGQRIFPNIQIGFVSVSDFLVPDDPGVIRGDGESPWTLVFSNGRTWSEPGDNGRSRAVIPFILSHYQWNEAHQGLMTFIYDDSSISNIHFQVTQENLPWAASVDFRGALSAEFSEGTLADAYTTERQFRRDVAMRIPVRPMADLASEVGAAALLDFNRGVPENKISQAGIIVDDVMYLQPAYTRTGDYPFPEEMRHGAFSVSKTAGGAIALLRLAQKYGDSVFDELIRDYVPVSAVHDGWENVTFSHTLSMVTGIGDAFPQRNAQVTFADEGDESNPHWYNFNYSVYLDGRLSGAFSFQNYSWGPGEVMRYNSAHTMILAVALDNYYKSKEGPDADLWQMLNEEVYQVIGIRWLPSMRLNIDHRTPGPAPLGWGLLPNPHDVARIANLLQNEGKFEGHQILHRQRTMRAMRSASDSAYDTAEWTQLQMGFWVKTSYRDGTWSSPVDSSGACSAVTSRMEGLGGNFVVMTPGGVTLFRFADANNYDAGALVLTGERIRPSCAE